MSALVVALAVAVVLLGLLVAGLLRSHAEILRRLHALDGGHAEHDAAAFRVRPGVVEPGAGATVAHDVAGAGPSDEAVVVGVVGTNHDTLLAFLSSGCTTCEGFWVAFGSDLALPGGARLVVVTKDPADESRGAIARLAPDGVPLVMSSQAWGDYEVPGSPYFAYVDGPSGRVVGEGSAQTFDQLLDLVGQAVGDRQVEAVPPDRVGLGDRVGLRDRDRAHLVDAELRAAGIDPGHPSLYPDPDPRPAPEPRR